MRRRLVVVTAVTAVVGSLLLVAVAGAGTSSKSITIDACSVSPTVSWTGFLTGSVQTEFKKYSGSRKVASAKSAPVNVVPAASSGTVAVPGPAAVTGPGWVLYEVTLFRYAAGKGSEYEKHFNCSLSPATTTTTSSTTSSTTTTSSSTSSTSSSTTSTSSSTTTTSSSTTTTTTDASCSVNPTNTVAPSISWETVNVYIQGSDGVWDFGANCTNTNTSYEWYLNDGTGWTLTVYSGDTATINCNSTTNLPRAQGVRPAILTPTYPAMKLVVTQYNEFGQASADSNVLSCELQ